MIQESNGTDRIRLDHSNQPILNEPDRYSIFRYTVQVTNPSFKDAIDIDFRLSPVEEAEGKFLVMNLNPVSLKVYAHDSRSLSFNVLVDTRDLTQLQVEDLKSKVQLEVTWREGFWTRSSDVKLSK
ncbi:hypothetical protein [Tumebacillus permanentifrigoris]|nr:hypothetical protein [Tumebacillus permanentifrigoris]